MTLRAQQTHAVATMLYSSVVFCSTHQTWHITVHTATVPRRRLPVLSLF